MALHRKFHHPYEPYDIQIDFMNALYECIDQRKVGIFESPTGTGKSLSLICGSLTWLRDHQLKDLHAQQEGDSDDEPEWVLAHAKAERRSRFFERRKNLENKLQKIREIEAQQRKRYETGEPLIKRQKTAGVTSKRDDLDDEEEFLLDDYDSDIEKSQRSSILNHEAAVSKQSLDLAIRIGLASEEKKDEDLILEEESKIFFCSRTHSQLVQFANEIRRVKIPFAEFEEQTTSEPRPIGTIKHLSLGSRKNLCINKDIRKLNSNAAINEKCLDMQQSKTSKKKCGFLPNKENETLVHQFRDHTLAKIRDIEDLGRLGEKIGICPYYASRATIQPSEIVTLPYPLLLQKSAREALGISVRDHVVIIDEAHNLMDAIAGIHSVQISRSQLNKARSQLMAYLQKFRNRLKGKNRVYVAQTVRLLDSLLAYLSDIVNKPNTSSEGTVKASDLLSGKGADQINLYKLSQYLQESKLARKVDSYTIFSDAQNQSHEVSTPVLTSCQSFFQALTYPGSEGRFFWLREDKEDVTLKYLLLDPMHSFKDIVDEARAVILAGGTMSPMEDYKQHLFPYLDSDRIMTLSCGHVIPAENLIAMPVQYSRSGFELDFTFDKRNDQRIIDGLGETLVELVSHIPDGVVIFFPSYAYLEQVISRWKKRSQATSLCLFERLQRLKPVIYESKSETAVITEDILERYSALINVSTEDSRGAILLSVVGGKLSEGINFSDKLGRGVFIVGLPFPNIKSAEWKAKLEYIEQQTLSRGGNATEAKNASRMFYENACMRAVNQCIGRAIRHRNDYAGIFLLDRRYTTERIQSKLPGWIQNGLVRDAGGLRLEEVTAKVGTFFEKKSENASV